MQEKTKESESDWFVSSEELFVSSDGLLRFPQPNAQAAARLVCFPPAGANAFMYDAWVSLLPKTLEICTIEFPDQEQEASQVIARISESLVKHARPGQKLVFFGACMGSFWAYEVACHLRDHAGIHIDQLIVVTFPAPHLREPAIAFGRTPEFASIMTSYFSPGSPEYLYVMSRLPYAVHAGDLADQPAHHDEPALRCPLTAFASLRDQVVDPQLLQGWQTYTSGHFYVHMCDGDHFYGQTYPVEFLQAVVEHIQEEVLSA